ncbi:Rz1-like lysis system protein LysC [Ewingella americana]
MLLQAKSVRSSLKRFCKQSRALWSLFLLPLLTSCSHTTTQYVQVPVTPIPASLLQQCLPSPPPSAPLTYGASVMWNELLLTDLQNCNSQISGIKQIEEARQK